MLSFFRDNSNFCYEGGKLMKYIIFGVLISIGWFIGKDIYSAIDNALDGFFYERFEWYREVKDKYFK